MLKLPAAEPEQPLQALGQHDEVAEHHAAEEEPRRGADDRVEVALLPGGEGRPDEGPELPDQERRGDDEAGDQPDLEADHEGLGRAERGDLVGRRGQAVHLVERPQQDLEDEGVEDRRDDDADGDGGGADQKSPPPQLVEVLEEREAVVGSSGTPISRPPRRPAPPAGAHPARRSLGDAGAGSAELRRPGVRCRGRRDRPRAAAAGARRPHPSRGARAQAARRRRRAADSSRGRGVAAPPGDAQEAGEAGHVPRRRDGGCGRVVSAAAALRCARSSPARLAASPRR